MQMQDILKIVSQMHLLFFVPLALIIADIFLYFKGVRFYAGVGIPIWWKKIGIPGGATISSLRTKLEAAFPRYAFRNNENSLWFRDGSKGYWTAWNIVLGFVGKCLVVRKSDGLSCRIYLNLSGLLLPCLFLDFFVFRPLTGDELTTMAVVLLGYAALLVIMTIIRINNFEKVFEAIAPESPSPQFLGRKL